jgi:ABC-type transport system involved in cytochrome c biogenesis permease subunit
VSSQVLLYGAAAAYLFGLVVVLMRASVASKLSAVFSCVGIGLQLIFIILRALRIGFLPFASRFEAMSLYALAVFVTGLVVFLVTRQRAVKAVTDGLGLVFLAGALAPVGFHPGGDLNPILNSPWFALHILVSFAGYGCLTAGLAWSLVHLFDRRLDFYPGVARKLALAGLLLLGAGITTGAAWADASWGVYWSWDPKESWALLTWVLALVYVHVGGERTRRGVALFFYALVFVAMMFTFIGINLLKFGLHRY